jgi:hypothetical protein
MELVADHVRILDWMPNGSVVYLLTSTIPGEILRSAVRDLDHDQQLRLLDRAVARWDGTERAMVELARVMLVVELGQTEAAREEFLAITARHIQSERVQLCARTLAGYLGW